MLTFGAEHPFHARLDLPRSARERRAAAEALVDPAVRHRVRRVLFVLYAADAALARSCARALVRAFARRGVDGRRRAAQRRPLLVRRAARPDRLRVGRHALRRDRPPLHRSVRRRRAGDPRPPATSWRRRVAPDRRGGRRRGCGARARGRRRSAPTSPGCAPPWTGAGAGVDPPDPATAARLLVALREPSRRGTRCSTRSTARGPSHRLPLWSAPGPAPRPPTCWRRSRRCWPSIAWLAGDGALAWCALERAAEGEPPCSLADLVGRGARAGAAPEPWHRR